MHCGRMTRASGSVALLVALSVPLMAAALLIVVDLGRIVMMRTRLAIASDRAATAGAATIANDLNRIAVANWRLHRAFRDLQSDFESDSQQDEATAQQRIRAYEQIRDAELETMDTIATALPARAHAIALATLEANAPGAAVSILDPASPRLRDDLEEDQYEELTYGAVEGPSSIDPESVKEGTYDALRLLVKERSQDAFLAITAGAEVDPLIVSALPDAAIRVRATAAAQAFGGSVEAFAEKETQDLAAAEMQLSSEGGDDLYRSALLPPLVADYLQAGGVW